MNKPQITREKLFKLVRKHVPDFEFGVVGVPAYFMNSMGAKGKNDRSIYDDAFFVVTPTVFAAFNGNTDPSIYREGVATLKCPQVIWYKPGIHRAGSPGGHPAFRQDAPVIVFRDWTQKFKVGVVHKKYGVCLGDGYWTDAGFSDYFWTNNHRGGYKGTSSLGCLTVPPQQWDAYYNLIMSELKRHGLKRFQMVLIPGPIN
jgi:lysozyme